MVKNKQTKKQKKQKDNNILTKQCTHKDAKQAPAQDKMDGEAFIVDESREIGQLLNVSLKYADC